MNMFTKRSAKTPGSIRSPRPGRREQKKEETKEAILAVALRLFKRKGFEKATLREIAKEAGIALGTTYNYFPTKEHLALYFFERAQDAVFERYRREEPPGASLEEKLFLVVALELEELAPYESFVHLAVMQAVVPASRLNPMSPDVTHLKKRYLAFVEALIGGSAERALAHVVRPTSMLSNVFWLYHGGLVLFWLGDTSPGKEDTLVLLDRSLRFLLEALRGDTGPPARKKARGQL